MSKTVAILIAVAAVISIIVFSFGFWLVGTRNEFIQQEQGIVAQYDQNRNNYDNFVKSVLEVGQVSAAYADDVSKVTREAIAGRYGEGGAKAVFQMIREENPKIDPAIYVKIQQVIEAGRISFENNQKTLIDRKRAYQTTLAQFPGSISASLFGFPRIDLSKYDIVTSDQTEKAFQDKKAAPIKVR